MCASVNVVLHPCGYKNFMKLQFYENRNQAAT